ncbi:death ligand signal enhancer [Salarias fasciatus]|uniref:DAP3 binding cell death enhancer 1 n=1 Tax=Salarias fasciatus TaxID=181472 RepID=A0A672F3B2_SALFA|nr:death ligand signal enhancer [Salarias fasciatus]
MWRVQAVLGRVLHRCHGSNTLRLPQSHHVEDEVLNSAVLSTSRQSSDSSSQKEEDGERRRKQRTFQFGYAELPRYTALDAVGWGAATVLFMQICRRIHSQFSSGTEPSLTPGVSTLPSTLQKCGYRVLLDSLLTCDVLPRGRQVSCLQGVSETQNQDQPANVSSSGSSAESAVSEHQEALLLQDSSEPEESRLSSSCPLQNDSNQNSPEKQNSNEEDRLSDEERLTAAALNLKRVGDTSVPVILNIIGLESAKQNNYKDAFACFVSAAQQGYSKAQFNTGVCYEKGRGVSKDKEKALHYYKQAALGGHTHAQYRYAKLLLTTRGQQSLEELNTAMELLEQAAAADLTKAQLCLASVYSQDPVRYGSKSVHYLKMAAASGDNTALLLLGQCYESGLGVQKNLKQAFDFYKQAAQAGNKQAQSLLTPPNNMYIQALRSIRSAPCFSAVDLQPERALSSLAGRVSPSTGRPAAVPLLPHSRSAGNLCVPLSFTATHLHVPSTERRACQ